MLEKTYCYPIRFRMKRANRYSNCLKIRRSRTGLHRNIKNGNKRNLRNTYFRLNGVIFANWETLKKRACTWSDLNKVRRRVSANIQIFRIKFKISPHTKVEMSLFNARGNFIRVKVTNVPKIRLNYASIRTFGGFRTSVLRKWNDYYVCDYKLFLYFS